MNRRNIWLALVVAIAAMGASGAWLYWPRQAGQPMTQATFTGPVAYYQDPDGKPYYSATPRKTDDGRDYRPVLARDEVSFEPQAAVADTSRRVKYYRNPMGLPDTSAVPKKDSMGMDYIPVYEGEDDDSSFKLSPGRIQRSGVKSEEVSRRTISPTLRVPGVVQLDERRVAIISMRMETWIQKVEDVTTGSRVRKGQPLMQVYSPAISSAAAEYVSILNSPELNKASNINRGAKQRLLNLSVPPEVIGEIEKTREVPLNVQWRAPRDGIVLERNAIEGMRAEPGEVLFRLADTSVVWVLLAVPERELGRIGRGQRVTVRSKAIPDREFEGKVDVVYPQLAKETRTVRVRVEIENSDLALLPDMYVEALVHGGRDGPVVSVPESAVIDTGSEQLVFIDRGEGVMQRRNVKVGARGDGFVEILQGLEEGESVVTAANFLLDAESNLRAAVKSYSNAETGK
jgi:Cu(I)/Ag(I) efflux system membrane fusion protein